MTTAATPLTPLQPASGQPTLAVRDLRTRFTTRTGSVMAVDGISFEVGRGRILGLVGESGSGKSVTGFSILGLIDPPGAVVGGSVWFEGRDLTRLSERELRALRGNRIAMIFQDPMMSLNPVLTIGEQMRETVTAHARPADAEVRRLVLDALAAVGIPAASERLNAYPHEFSGGMRQRVAIAMALLHRPALIIADEPTTALDVTIQAQILSEVQSLAREQGTAIIWISHDLSVVSGLADDVAVMSCGQIVESGPVDKVLVSPGHPYTKGLIGSVASQGERGRPLMQIQGMPPRLDALPKGCRFRPRCEYAADDCLEPPAVRTLSEGRSVRCHRPLIDA